MTTRSVDFDADIDSSLLAAHLAACLKEVNAQEVEVTANRVMFKGGIFRFVTNWNILVPFGFGDLTVNSETRQIVYTLSCRQLIIFMTIMVGVFMVLVLSIARRLPGNSIALPLMLLVAITSNLAIGLFRFRGFLSRTIESAPRIKGGSKAVPV